jgi:4-amino-4-deoxy-L-arabinose transferase-like glycosyltransferase
MTTIPTAEVLDVEVVDAEVLDDATPLLDESAPPAEAIVPVAPPTTPTPQVHQTFAPAPRQRWERPALLALLLVTGVLYLWDLSASGWANSFYSAAVQAGSVSWKAFLFGASDAAASITVDKPPASLWVMALSARIFGLSSWSLLVPQALMGMATVGLVFTSVRRYFSAQAGLIAGAVLALTPVAALMFRFNNPDSLLVLLLTGAVVATLRAIENGRTRWMVLAGVLVGLGFLTKQLQAVLVLPGIAAVYLIAAPVSLWRRIRDGLIAVAAMLLSAGWWVAIVELTPAANRPYVGGSTDNSFLNLTFGYNGLGRIFGNETTKAADAAGTALGGTALGAPAGLPTGAGGGMFNSNVGILRMFAGDLGGHVAWLIPAALLLGFAGLLIVGRAKRTDVRRAALLLWGATLVVTGLTFSLMDGIFHQYYTVALAPSIGALVGIGAWLLWTRRAARWALPLLAVVSLVTTGWAFVILARSPEWNPWLRWAVLAVGLIAAAGMLLGRRLGATVLRTGVVLALVAALAGPTAWTVQTVLNPHQGGAVTTGPAVEGVNARGLGGPGGLEFRGDVPGGRGVARSDGAAGQVAGGASDAQAELPGGQQVPGQTIGGTRGAQGMPGTTAVSDAMIALLLKDAGSYTWVAATTGAENAASYQLATEKSVMPIGGFSGSDPSPTLAQFQSYVGNGQIHYFIASTSGPGGGRGGAGQRGGGEGGSSSISTWVSENFTAQTVGGVTVYDLTAPVG